MNDVADTMTFPETPLEMFYMLKMEDYVKRAGNLTHVGMNGYLTRGGENGPIARGILEQDWDAEGDRATDTGGVQVL